MVFNQNILWNYHKVLIVLCYCCSTHTISAQQLSEQELLTKDRLATDLQQTNVIKALEIAEANYEYVSTHKVSDYVMARITYSLGSIYNISGDFVKSIDYNIASIQLFTKLKLDKELLNGYNSLGGTYYQVAEYDQTIFYTNKALEIAKSLNLQPNISMLENNLGGAYRQLNQFDQALAHAFKSANIAKKNNGGYNLIFAYSTIGEVYLDTHQYDNALYYLNLAYDTGKDKNIITTYSSTFCKLGIASSYWGLLDTTMALTYAQQAYPLAKVNGYISFQRDAAELLSHIWRARGSKDSTYHYQSEMIALSDSLWTKEKEIQLNRVIIKYKDSEIRAQKSKADYQEFLVNGGTIIGILLLISSVILIRANRKVKMLYKKVTKQTEELQHLHQVKDKMFSMVMHDFKTPINSLESMLNLIIKKYMTPDEAVLLAQNMLQDLQKSKASINNLIVWAKSQLNGLVLKPIQIDVDVLLKDAKSYHMHQAEAKQIEVTAINKDNFQFEGDRDILIIILNNLLSNALKFTNERGKVSLSAEEQENHIVFEVSDSGVGISPDHLLHIFDLSHYTTDGTSSEKGTGLGLIICKELVEKLNGSISAISKLEKGTTFQITLPKLL